MNRSSVIATSEMISDEEIETRINRMNPTEIAYQLELRGVIRKKRLDDIQTFEKSLQVETLILDVLQKLISRVDRTRGPIPTSVYERDREICNKNILLLKQQLGETKALLQSAESVYHFIRNFRPAPPSNEYAGLRGFEKEIHDFIRYWDRNALAKIQVVSKSVVSAISSSSKIVLSGINDPQATAKLLETLRKFVGRQSSQESTESNLTQIQQQNSPLYTAWTYIRFIFTLFTEITDFSQTLAADDDFKECLTKARIKDFGLPNALSCLNL